jgi:hypothetical protein
MIRFSGFAAFFIIVLAGGTQGVKFDKHRNLTRRATENKNVYFDRNVNATHFGVSIHGLLHGYRFSPSP